MRRTIGLLLLAVVPLGFGFDQLDDFFDAARTGNLEAVKALLAKGVDVDAKWRYDATALMMAARRGHADVVRLLLEHSADVNVKDTFYGMTPLSSAASEGHGEIVKMLLARGAQGSDQVLLSAVGRNDEALVRIVLEHGGLEPEVLSRALTRANRNNRESIAEALRKAGAVPLAEPKFQVDEATLRTYAGVYRNERETEFRFEFKDGSLVGGPPGQALKLSAFDRTTFQPGQFDEVLITFHVDGDKVTGVTIKQGTSTSFFRRVEAK